MSKAKNVLQANPRRLNIENYQSQWRGSVHRPNLEKQKLKRSKKKL